MFVEVGAIVHCAGLAAAVAERDRNVLRAPVGVVDHAALLQRHANNRHMATLTVAVLSPCGDPPSKPGNIA